MRRRRVGCDQFDEYRLGCFASEGGNSTEPFLQSHIVQPQRVRDEIYAMLASQVDSGLP